MTLTDQYHDYIRAALAIHRDKGPMTLVEWYICKALGVANRAKNRRAKSACLSLINRARRLAAAQRSQVAA
jgi:hypothetical protein